MTIVETTVTISINQEGQSLEELEAQISEAVRRAGRELLLQACRGGMEDGGLETGLVRWVGGFPPALPAQPARIREPL